MIRLRWLIAGVLLATVAGCSTQTFVGQQYANFTAYYNKFYNAQKAFDQGVRATEQVNEPIDRDQYLSLFVPAGNAPDPAPFDRAIKKSSDVLREHAGSKWIDDALLLIGKSYFYQRNFVGAEQKFREIIAIESELEGEARFWLGRVLVAAENYTAAADHLQGSLDAATLDDRWAAMTSLVLGELRVQQEQWPEAAAALQQGLEGDVGNAAEAEASFLLGQVLETLGTYEGAVQAYERAARQSPSYELSYAAQVSAVRVQGLHLNADEALRTLRNMEADGKNFDKRKELALLRGRLRAAQGRPRAAERVYRDLLYDENGPARGDLQGRAHHALAVLYRDAYRDFSAAAAHFDTASSSLARPNERSLRRAPAAIRDSREQARVFGAVANRASDVARMDSLLRLGQLDDEAFQTFVADLQEQRAAEQAAQRAARERQQATRQFAQNQPRGGTTGRAATSQSQAVNTAGGEAGFLFYKDPGRAQQAQQAFRQRWGDRPRVPNWRRRGAISGQITSNEADGAPGAATPTTAAAQGPAVSLVDVSEVPRDSASQAEMRADRALARYELGNALFLTANRPDSAAAWYRRVTEEDSEYPVSRRALYALAEARTATGDTAAAQRLYRRVVTQYPQSAFAERAQDQLGTPAGRSQAAASAVDSTALARQAYDAAYQQWKQNRHAAALEEMVRVAEQYASTDAAPRALLAAGTIYLEQLRADSVQTDSIRASTPLPDVFASVLSLTDSTQVSTQVSSPDSTARPTAESSLADSVRSPARAPVGSNAIPFVQAAFQRIRYGRSPTRHAHRLTR